MTDAAIQQLQDKIELLNHVLAEIVESQSTANAILVLALAKQLDHIQLRHDIITATSAVRAAATSNGSPFPGATERLLAKVLAVLPEHPPH